MNYIEHYIEHLLILASAVTGYISIYAFAFLVCIPIGITSSTIEIKICTITSWIKKYKSIIKKIKKKHDKIALLAKSKVNSIKVLISKALIGLNTSHDEFVLINNLPKEYDDLKKETKNLKT